MNRGKTWVQNTAAVLRVILGLIFAFSGIGFFFTPLSTIIGDPTSTSGIFMSALIATGYFLPFLKVIEALCGLTLIFSKRFAAFILVILAPITIHIFLYSLFLYPSILFAPILLLVIEIFLAWFNWHKFAPIFKR